MPGKTKIPPSPTLVGSSVVDDTTPVAHVVIGTGENSPALPTVDERATASALAALLQGSPRADIFTTPPTSLETIYVGELPVDLQRQIDRAKMLLQKNPITSREERMAIYKNLQDAFAQREGGTASSRKCELMQILLRTQMGDWSGAIQVRNDYDNYTRDYPPLAEPLDDKQRWEIIHVLVSLILCSDTFHHVPSLSRPVASLRLLGICNGEAVHHFYSMTPQKLGDLVEDTIGNQKNSLLMILPTNPNPNFRHQAANLYTDESTYAYELLAEYAAQLDGQYPEGHPQRGEHDLFKWHYGRTVQHEPAYNQAWRENQRAIFLKKCNTVEMIRSVRGNSHGNPKIHQGWEQRRFGWNNLAEETMDTETSFFDEAMMVLE